MNHLITLAFCLLCFALPANAQFSLKVGSQAPPFAITSLDGSTLDLSEMRGKIVVVVFWSTRCVICHAEMPKLNRFAERYASKAEMLAFSMENEDKLNAYLQGNPFKFRVAANTLGTLVKYADRDQNERLNMAFPSFFVIDQQGVVRHRASGFGKTDTMASVVDKLLQRQHHYFDTP